MHRILLSFVLALALVGASGCVPPVGYPGFASPQADPIALSPLGGELYVANTPADTLDVIDTTSFAVLARVAVGLDPVSVAVRPDGLEVWVSNHVSDTVSVIDVDPASPTRYQVIATVHAWDDTGLVTEFDEPVGIAFASNAKAYVALSSRNLIAVVDVASRTVTSQFYLGAQEPRAIKVRGGRLYAIPFESGNQTELSGCLTPATIPDCTFNVTVLQANNNDAILTRNLVADIIRNPDIVDNDLFVYDTADETLLHRVPSLGTLLYGLAIDSQGRAFVALTEARNDANGRSGTQGHDLVDMENRAFLNQVARVDCGGDCTGVDLFDLEPLPPQHPAPGEALATPFGIQVSEDDQTLVAVASGSNRLFTMDATTGAVLGTAEVGEIPRGLVIESDPNGAPARAFVLNAIGGSVSVVDLSSPGAPVETRRIALADPTLPDVKRGRIAFNDASGSTTGTFSCASCHPDGNTDQLLWNLGARCITDGCDQTQPRTTMPIRGLRDTLPLHWDGVPGDPVGGINAELADSGQVAAPNCTDEHSCFRDLVNGAMSGTMCTVGACPTDRNELGMAGAFSEAERDAMAVFLRSVPYPPARSRRLDDRMSPLAAEGFRNFLVGIDEDHPGCSRAGACHSLPFWAGTNTPGTGFDAPTFRGLTDRHLLLPNGRAGMWVLLRLQPLNEVIWDALDGPDELFSWGVTFGTEFIPNANRNSSGTGPFSFFQLFEEGSTGFAGALGKQVTLDATTAQAIETRDLLDHLERADAQGVVDLRAAGMLFPCSGPACPPGSDEPSWAEQLTDLLLSAAGGEPDAPTPRTDATPLDLVFEDGIYASANPQLPGPKQLSTQQLVDAAAAGHLVITATARIGRNSTVNHPQPALWLPSRGPAFNFLQALPELTGPAFGLFGRHVVQGAGVLIDGAAVDATVSCEIGGTLPDCEAERLHIDLAAVPAPGEHTFQVTTPDGLLSNEVLVIVP